MRYPAFGGFFVDSAGDPHVVLTEGGVLDDARRAIVDVFGLGDRFAGHRWSAVEGRFGYVQLADWRDRLIALLGGASGITRIGMDQRHNRIVVGIASEDVRMSADRMIAEAGVPLDAVRVAVLAPMRPVESRR